MHVWCVAHLFGSERGPHMLRIGTIALYTCGSRHRGLGPVVPACSHPSNVVGFARRVAAVPVLHPIAMAKAGAPPRRTTASKLTLHRLQRYGAPASFVRIVLYVIGLSNPKRELDLFEVCSGVGALNEAFRRHGLSSEGYDIVDDPVKCDLNGTHGFLHAVRQVLRLRRNGLLFGGCPCSTWVWCNRGTSMRSRQAPLGNGELSSVASANTLVSRFALLVLLAVARGAFWLVEQPGSSLMEWHPRIAAVRAMGLRPDGPCTCILF